MLGSKVILSLAFFLWLTASGRYREMHVDCIPVRASKCMHQCIFIHKFHVQYASSYAKVLENMQMESRFGHCA